MAGLLQRVRIRDGEALSTEPSLKPLSLSLRFIFRFGGNQTNQRATRLAGKICGAEISVSAPAWQGLKPMRSSAMDAAIAATRVRRVGYLYDDNGRLVPAGSGNGRAARYIPIIFSETVTGLHQSLRLQAGINRAGPSAGPHSVPGKTVKPWVYLIRETTSISFRLMLNWRNRFKYGILVHLAREIFLFEPQRISQPCLCQFTLTPVSFENARKPARQWATPVIAFTRIIPCSCSASTPEDCRSWHPGYFSPWSNQQVVSASKLHQSARSAPGVWSEGYVAGTANFTANQFQHRSRTSESYLVNPTIHAELVNSG